MDEHKDGRTVSRSGQSTKLWEALINACLSYGYCYLQTECEMETMENN